MGALADKSKELFCREYLVDFNKTKAYMRMKQIMGKEVTNKNASNYGCKYFNEKEVAQRINELMEEREKNLGMDAYQVVRELQKIAFSRITDAINYCDGVLMIKNLDEIPPETLDCIESMKVSYSKDGTPIHEIKFYSKITALQTLAKHHGILNEKIEITQRRTYEDAIREAKEAELERIQSEI